MSASTSASSDSNTMLIQLCVKALASVAPDGMTTKDLAAALDKEVKGTPDFNGISSSILSSKLNAIFRRCHGDSSTPNRSQLAELPLTRSQSLEVPRRLVYRYTPADSADASEAPSTPAEDSSSGDESAELNEPLTPKEESLADNQNSFGPATKKRRVSGNALKKEQYATEPGTPPEIVSKEDSQTSDQEHVSPVKAASKHVQEVEKEEQTSQESAESKPSLPQKHAQTQSQSQSQSQSQTQTQTQTLPKPKRPAFSSEKTVGFNLYYDALGLDAMSAALNLKQSKATEEETHSKAGRELDVEASSDLDWSDFPSPELLGLHELDGFVC